jgi:hypothetical protein
MAICARPSSSDRPRGISGRGHRRLGRINSARSCRDSLESFVVRFFDRRSDQAGVSTQPFALAIRTVDAGYRASFSAGRMGRATSSPPQFGHLPPNAVCAQSRQKAHSKLQIMASEAAGGRSLLQHSQLGRRSNIVVPSGDQRLATSSRRYACLDLRIVLRTLASIEHAVVADNAHDPMT